VELRKVLGGWHCGTRLLVVELLSIFSGASVSCYARCVIAGRVFKHVGRVQFEISKSLELYVS
jgi:hypothetical protein